MTLARVIEIRRFVQADGTRDLFVGLVPYAMPTPPMPETHKPYARVMWLDENGVASRRAREQCDLDDLVLLAPREHGVGRLQAWEVAMADVHARFQHARLFGSPEGYVIVVPDDPTQPLTSAGTCLCHPTPHFADAWINSAVNAAMGAQ